MAATIGALADAAERSPFAVDLVVVDDGSTDGSGEAAAGAAAGRLPCRVLSQPNRGRFRARRAGLEAADGELVLLLDARVRLHADALAFVAERVAAGRARLERARRRGREREPVRRVRQRPRRARLARLLPRPAHDELRPRGLRPLPEGDDVLPRAAGAAARGVRDVLDAVRRPAARERRHARAARPRRAASGSTSRPRSPARTRRAARCRRSCGTPLHRGVVFLDGHGRRESRFFPAVVAFYPVSAALAVAALRRPALVPVGALGVAAAAGAVAAAAGRPRFEALSFAALAPVYAVAHGAGMWKGAVLALRRAGLDDPRRLRDDRGADQARAGAPPAGGARAPLPARDDRAAGAADPDLPRRVRPAAARPLARDAAPAAATCGRTGTSPAGSARVLASFARRPASLRRALRDGPGRPLVLVHGDTMTTVLGAAMGRALRVPSAHIESGLRSFDLRHPFPEELNRRLTSRLASIHYAPGAVGGRQPAPPRRRRHRLEHDPRQPRARRGRAAAGAGARGRAVRRRLAPPLRAAQRPRAARRGRSRRCARPRRGRRSSSSTTPSRPPRSRASGSTASSTTGSCACRGCASSTSSGSSARASFVVTDSGGSQEECFYLDRPCLVHRVRTERQEGLGENVVLSGMRDEALRDVPRRPVALPAPLAAPGHVALGRDRRRPRAARDRRRLRRSGRAAVGRPRRATSQSKRRTYASAAARLARQAAGSSWARAIAAASASGSDGTSSAPASARELACVRRHVGEDDRQPGREVGLELPGIGVAGEARRVGEVRRRRERGVREQPLDVAVVGDEAVEADAVAERRRACRGAPSSSGPVPTTSSATSSRRATASTSVATPWRSTRCPRKTTRRRAWPSSATVGTRSSQAPIGTTSARRAARRRARGAGRGPRGPPRTARPARPRAGSRAGRAGRRGA